jgi:hypothetical protein
MKRVAAVVLLVAVFAGVLFLEYEMAMWLGLGFLLVAGCGLTVIGVALYRAPQGCESRGALYIRQGYTARRIFLSIDSRS